MRIRGQGYIHEMISGEKEKKRKTVEKRKRGGRLRRNLILKGGNMNLEGGGGLFLGNIYP